MALFALESGEFFFQIDLPDFQHGVSMGPSKLRQMVRALLSAGASSRLLPIFPMAQRGQRWNVSSAELRTFHAILQLRHWHIASCAFQIYALGDFPKGVP